MNERKTDLWIATFGDVTKYMRERKNSIVKSIIREDSVIVNISCTLDLTIYEVPLTLKTYIPDSWTSAGIANKSKELAVQKDAKGSYVLYSAMPNEGEVIITE
jgi:hypothetical protein